MTRSSMLFVVLALCLLVPSGAFAQATTLTSRSTSEIDAVVFGDCLSEPIHVTGELRSVFHFTLDAAGVAHFTGATNAFLLVSRGGQANFLFHVTQVFVVNGNGEVTAEVLESRVMCVA